MSKLFFVLSLAGCFAACNQKKSAELRPDILAVNVDSSMKPSEDFFAFANGKWIKNNPIPDDQSGWGIGNLVVEENLKRLREISGKASASKTAKGSNDQKIGDFWSTAMDSAQIEANGLKPIQPLLDKLNAVKDIPGFLQTITGFKKIGSNTFFAEYVSQDDKKSDEMAYGLWQGGLALPEREYYFKTDSATVNIRKEYVKVIADLLALSGEDAAVAATAANNILAMETKLATASRKIEDLREPYRNYNKMAIADLGKMAHNIDWVSHLANMDVKNIDSVIVGQPEFFRALNNVLLTTPLADLKQYVKFNLLADLAGVLPEAYEMRTFNFLKVLTGAKTQKPRWKRAIEREEGAMGEMLGQLYVKEFFNEEARERYTVMVENIRIALKDRIGRLDWMGDSTKQKAYKKLAAMKGKIGYPEK